MTLEELIKKAVVECNGAHAKDIEVRVLSLHWSSVYSSIVDAPVISVGYDVNSGILYIEINKTEP